MLNNDLILEDDLFDLEFETLGVFDNTKMVTKTLDPVENDGKIEQNFEVTPFTSQNTTKYIQGNHKLLNYNNTSQENFVLFVRADSRNNQVGVKPRLSPMITDDCRPKKLGSRH